MKKLLIVFFLMNASQVNAQSFEIEQLALDVSKLGQLKSILTDLYKGYEILNAGYTAIKNISQGNFTLHQAFLNSLLAVSPAIKNYSKVADIINNEGRIVSEYKNAYNQFSQDKHFNPDELTYLINVYNNLISGSLSNMTHLLTVLTAGSLRMSDDERLHAVDGIYSDSQDKLMFLRQFNNSTTLLAMQRSVEANDFTTLQQLYGLP